MLYRPSYKTGFARCGANSAAPELHKGLVAAYVPALGSTGDVLRDQTVYGNNGTLTNMALGSCWTGDSVRLDGVNDYISIPAASQINFTGASNYSLVVRFRTSNGASNQQPARKRSPGPPLNEYSYGIGVISNLCYFWQELQGVSFAETIGGFTIVNNQIHTVIGTSNGGAIALYGDGILAGTGTLTFTAAATTSLAPLIIGSNFGSGEFFPGDIFQVLVYNRALLPVEVKLLHTDPYALWRMLDYYEYVYSDGLIFLSINHSIPLSHILNISTNGSIPLSHIISFSTNQSVPVSHLLSVTTDGSIPLEHVLGVSNLSNIPLSHLLNISDDESIFLEHLIEIINNVSMPVEHLIGVINNGSIPLSHLIGLSFDNSLATEHLVGISNNGVLSIEHLAQAVVNGSIPVEWLGIRTVGPLLVWCLNNRETEWSLLARETLWILAGRATTWTLDRNDNTSCEE